MTQGELDCLLESCSFPDGIQTRLPEADETIASICPGKVAFYEASFQAYVFLFTPRLEGLGHCNICPAQLAPNVWRSVVGVVVLWQIHKFALSLNEFRNLFGLFNNPKPDSGWLYFKARTKRTYLHHQLKYKQTFLNIFYHQLMRKAYIICLYN